MKYNVYNYIKAEEFDIKINGKILFFTSCANTYDELVDMFG